MYTVQCTVYVFLFVCIQINLTIEFYVCSKGIGGGAKGAKGKNLSPQQIAEITNLLTKIVGPKLAKLVTQLLVTLANGALGKAGLGGLIKPVITILVKLLKSNGLAEKLLAGGNPKAKSGKNLSPAQQAELAAILNQTVGPYTSKYLVRLTALLVNGLLGQIPLGKLTTPVVEIVEKLLGGHNVLSQLLGRKGNAMK